MRVVFWFCHKLMELVIQYFFIICIKTNVITLKINGERKPGRKKFGVCEKGIGRRPFSPEILKSFFLFLIAKKRRCLSFIAFLCYYLQHKIFSLA